MSLKLYQFVAEVVTDEPATKSGRVNETSLPVIGVGVGHRSARQAKRWARHVLLRDGHLREPCLYALLRLGRLNLVQDKTLRQTAVFRGDPRNFGPRLGPVSELNRMARR